MELVSKNGKMDLSTMEIGLITPWKERDITSLQTEASMMEIGLIISSMDKEDKLGQMEEHMRVHSIMELKKDKESIHGLMVRNMMELGLTANSTGRVLSQHLKEKSEEAFGKLE